MEQTWIVEARVRVVERRATAARLLASLGHDFDGVVEAARDSNGDDEHDPDGATVAFERSQISALLRTTEQTVAACDAALVRLGEGGYGTCERCAGPIGEERLAARPTSTLCMTCLR